MDWVREVMAARRLTQRQVAMLAGIHHSSLSRLLGGERVKLSYETARRLYRALERTPTKPLLERTFMGDVDAVRVRGASDVARRRPD